MSSVPPEFRRRSKQHKPKSAAELLEENLPPIRWTVPRVLPEGLTVLGGKPKMGKSWLALGLCVSVASGGHALGKVEVECGSALYLGLEDNKRRLQRRLKKMLGGGECPANLYYETEWPKLGDGCVEDVREWLQEHDDCRL